VTAQPLALALPQDRGDPEVEDFTHRPGMNDTWIP